MLRADSERVREARRKGGEAMARKFNRKGLDTEELPPAQLTRSSRDLVREAGPCHGYWAVGLSGGSKRHTSHQGVAAGA